MGSVPAQRAEENLKKFLHQLIKADGIQLLIYCIRGSRATKALLRNYRIFYTAICRRKAPVVVVVTGLENYEGNMEGWWTVNERELKRCGMRFQDHVCITTLAEDESMHPALRQRCKESYTAVCSLIRKNCRAVRWTTDEETWLKRAFADVRPLMNAKRDGESIVTPNVFVCEGATADRGSTQIAGSISGQWTSCVMTIDGMSYSFHNVHLPDLERRRGSVSNENPDLLILYTGIKENANNHVPQTLKSNLAILYEYYGSHLCPLILVIRGTENRRQAKRWWSQVVARVGVEGMHVIPTYFPETGTGEDAQKTLQELIAEWCLDRITGAKMQRPGATASSGGPRFFFWGRKSNGQNDSRDSGRPNGIVFGDLEAEEDEE